MVIRNIIGATVGVQPFGGSGLVRHGAEGGRTLYLGRLLATRASRALEGLGGGSQPPPRKPGWPGSGRPGMTRRRAHGRLCQPFAGRRVARAARPGRRANAYALKARGRIGADASDAPALLTQVSAILAAGAGAVVEATHAAGALASLPPAVAGQITRVGRFEDAAASAGCSPTAKGRRSPIFWPESRHGTEPIVPVQSLTPEAMRAGDDFALHRLMEEVAIATTRPPPEGNASLMSIG